MKSDISSGDEDRAEARQPQSAATEPSAWWKRLGLATPYVLAMLMGGLSLRNVSCGNAVFSDAARHAMNGAMIYDLAKSGEYGDPVAFATDYFQTYPATSLPYHAPILPILEALFFAVFGVNLLASRLAIAFCSAVLALLLYRLVRHTHHSDGLAAACVLACFAVPLCHLLTTDVMLEIPSLALALLAIYQLRDLDDRYSMGRALAFAIAGGLAVWTKQHTVFLGVLPFVYVVVAGKWSLLLRKEIWISSAVFGAFCIAMLMLHRTYLHAGMSRQFPASAEFAEEVIVRNTKFYSVALMRMLRPAIAVIVVSSMIGLLVQKFRGKAYNRATDLYFAWSVAAIGVPLWASQFDGRYVFYAVPSLVALGCIGLTSFLQRPLGQYAEISVALAAGILFLTSMTEPTSYLVGPAEIADLVAEESPRRVLYCGETDGAFVFAMRSRAGRDEPAQIIRGDKIPVEFFQRDNFQSFVQEYAIDVVVLERANALSPWDSYVDEPLDSMKLLSEVPLKCRPYKAWNGELFVYRMPPASGKSKKLTTEIFRLRKNDSTELP